MKTILFSLALLFIGSIAHAYEIYEDTGTGKFYYEIWNKEADRWKVINSTDDLTMEKHFLLEEWVECAKWSVWASTSDYYQGKHGYCEIELVGLEGGRVFWRRKK